MSIELIGIEGLPEIFIVCRALFDIFPGEDVVVGWNYAEHADVSVLIRCA